MQISRRRFGALAGGLLASMGLGEACQGANDFAAPGDGRFTVRPHPTTSPAKSGTRTVGLESGRDALLHVPTANGPMPLLVMLHGATGSGQGVFRRVAAASDESGVAVLAPDSRGTTWDAIRGDFGRDVRFIDRAMDRVFDLASIDASRVAVGGFSDGATYALALGLMNGGLFRRVVAFSPGFLIDGRAHGRPEFFISHGRSDTILPIDQTSRVIVPALQRRGYTVTFREFDGIHEVPPEIAAEGLRWAAATTAA
jgi:predicted esterase